MPLALRCTTSELQLLRRPSLGVSIRVVVTRRDRFRRLHARVAWELASRHSASSQAVELLPQEPQCEGRSQAAFEARAVQKDARIIDKSGGRDRVSVAVGFACIKKALHHCSFVELHVSGLDVDERPYHSLHIIVIDKVGTVTAAALHHVGCISVKHSLTAFTENAAVV